MIRVIVTVMDRASGSVLHVEDYDFPNMDAGAARLHCRYMNRQARRCELARAGSAAFEVRRFAWEQH